MINAIGNEFFLMNFRITLMIYSLKKTKHPATNIAGYWIYIGLKILSDNRAVLSSLGLNKFCKIFRIEIAITESHLGKEFLEFF